MNVQRPYRKFNPLEKKIEDLEKKNPRFKRIFSEYEIMSDEIYNMETSEESSLPDDFIDAVKLQREYLEEEIDGWLINGNPEEK